MSGYCVRIDDRELYIEKINSLALSTDYTKILAARHTGDKNENPHYHLVISTQCKDKAFRARMVKVFDKGKGNGHMSIKPFDGNEDAYSYLFHEELMTTKCLISDEVSAESASRIVLNKGFTDSDIQRFRDRNQQVQVLMKEAKGKATALLENEVLDYLKKHDDALTIAKAIVGLALRKGSYLPNDFLLKNMTDKVMFKLQGGDLHSEDYVIENIARRALRMN